MDPPRIALPQPPTTHRSTPDKTTLPWSMAMNWHDLLFAHWPVPVESLRPHIPAELEIDTCDGTAWIGLVPFHMTGVRSRWMPSFCGMAFPELNVRTYVKDGNKNGVWFLSLDAAHWLSVRVARAWYHLPYHDARIEVQKNGEGISFRCQRKVSGASTAAEFQIEYTPIGDPFSAKPGTLEHWLIERYCLFAVNHRGRVGCADIAHAPWRLHRAEAVIARNTMTQPLGIRLPDQPPLLHFAHEVQAAAWKVRAIARDLGDECCRIPPESPAFPEKAANALSHGGRAW